MGFFKSAEEKAREATLEKRIFGLDRFTGSLEEYNALKGQEYAIIDTGRPQKFVNIDNGTDEREYIELLMEQGCEGFVRYVPSEGSAYTGTLGGHGIPVKRK